MSFSVGIIKTNNFKVMEVSNIKYEYFLSIVHDYCEIIKCDTNDDILELFYKKCNMNDNDMNDTYKCYEDEKYIYELCCKTEYDDNNINGLGSYLVYGKQLICGPCLILKSNITDEVIREKISHDDIALILYKHFMHKCLLINYNQRIQELYYIMEPNEIINEHNLLFNKTYEINLFNFTLIIYHNNNSNNILKEILKNKYCINSLIVLKLNSDSEYIDIDSDLYDKIHNYLITNSGNDTSNYNYGLQINKDTGKKYIFNSHKLLL